MTYSAEISRDNPTMFLFMIDQSGSMDEKMTTGKSKAAFVADVLNKTLSHLIVNCTKAEGIRNYFDIAVIGYGGNGVVAGLGGALGGKMVHPISDLGSAPLRIENRTRLMDDGVGGVVETSSKFPVWFDPISSGGTPMRAALMKAAEVLVEWCDAHPNNYPPTVLHITDGASTDGDPEDIMSAASGISTNDGSCLFFNLHVSTQELTPIEFANSESQLPDDYARMLFRMSSVLPNHVAKFAQDKGYPLKEAARGFMFNADARKIADFFEIGTRPRLTVDK